MTQLRARRKGDKTLDVVDETNPLPVSVIDLAEALTTDELLASLLLEMRIQNAHLALMTGEELVETDLATEG